jgi:hypothetical protein
MRSRLGSACPSDKSFPFDARRGALGLLAQACSLFSQFLFERLSLFETTPVEHGAAPFAWAGAQLAFSSPIEAKGRAVMQRQ